MLVLSRKVGEKIYIGSEIKLQVKRLKGNRVAIAINAPPKIRVLRGELVEQEKTKSTGVEVTEAA